MGSDGVAQGVGCERYVQRRPRGHDFHALVEVPEAMPPFRQEEGFLSLGSGFKRIRLAVMELMVIADVPLKEPRAAFCKVTLQVCSMPPGNGDIALFIPLTRAHEHQPPVEVYIGAVQVGGFTAPQTTAVEDGQDGPVTLSQGLGIVATG